MTNKIKVKQSRYAHELSYASTLEELLNVVTDYIKQYGKDAKIEHYYDGEVLIEYYRDETDAEFNARQKKLAKQRERAEQKRLAEKAKALAELAKREEEEKELYEQLKKKYG